MNVKKVMLVFCKGSVLTGSVMFNKSNVHYFLTIMSGNAMLFCGAYTLQMA